MSRRLSLAVGGRVFECGLVIFDLDGTLVDSVPDIAAAVDATAVAADLAPPGEDRVRDWVGNGSRMLIRRLLAHGQGREPDEGMLDEAHSLFLAAYETRLVQESRVYPGGRELLAALAGRALPMACVTNKPERLARGVLDGLGLGDAFQWVLGGDSLPEKKPDPAPLRYVMEAAGVTPAETLLVGDSETDVAAARNAGCSIVVARYGYNQGFEQESAQPDVYFDALSEIRIPESS